MRRAKVYVHNSWAGVISEDEEGYQFQYRSEYLNIPGAEPVSLTLPLQESPFRDRFLFPFLTVSFLKDGYWISHKKKLENRSTGPNGVVINDLL